MAEMNIPFNKPFFTGEELANIRDAVDSGKISGNGEYTRKCQTFFEDRYGFGKCLLTNSCTDALEMTALLMDLQPGDEVIVPSYTFVSTANAFVLRGARIRFVDSRPDHPGMDEAMITSRITDRTKAIVAVHYGGVACDMDKIMNIAQKHNLFVVEDAAHAIDSYYVGRNGEKQPLGSIGHFATFSFHETKNIISGEGGMLVINDPEFYVRAEIIWEKGTDRAAFFRGETDKYTWVDLGSSFLPSEITAAFLWAQINNLEKIQKKRLGIWETYYRELSRPDLQEVFTIPNIPEYATKNGHLFSLVCNNGDTRKELIRYLRDEGIHAVFHYLSLHQSRFYKNRYAGEPLENSDRYSECLVRLPLFYDLKPDDVELITDKVTSFF